MTQIFLNKVDVTVYLEEFSIEENLEEMFQSANIRFVIDKNFPAIGPGNAIAVQDGKEVFFDGVVWETSSENRGQKHMDVLCYDRTIYLAKSKEEYLWPDGNTTAADRIRKYCSDWGLPVVNIPSTGVKLAKTPPKVNTIYDHIMQDLKETVSKGGKMYRPRMAGTAFELFELASNATVYEFEPVTCELVGQKRTLEGAVTKVKVTGNAPEGQRAKVLAEAVGNTAALGTIQEILTSEKAKDIPAAKKMANEGLAGIQESFGVRSIDIVNMRAGDKIRLNGIDLVVNSVKHENGRHMDIELAYLSAVRRRLYGDNTESLS